MSEAKDFNNCWTDWVLHLREASHSFHDGIRLHFLKSLDGFILFSLIFPTIANTEPLDARGAAASKYIKYYTAFCHYVQRRDALIWKRCAKKTFFYHFGKNVSHSARQFYGYYYWLIIQRLFFLVAKILNNKGRSVRLYVRNG